MGAKTWKGTTGDYGLASNWLEASIPIAADDVRLPAGAGKISSGFDQSTVAIASFIANEGYAASVGLSTASLRIKLAAGGTFDWSGAGQSYLEVASTATDVDATIRNTAPGSIGEFGLYLDSSDFNVCSIMKGKVSIASRSGKSGKATSTRVLGGSCTMGDSVTSKSTNGLITVDVEKGNLTTWCPLTNVQVYGGNCTIEGKTTAATVSTVLSYSGGIAVLNTVGLISSAIVSRGGVLDFTKTGVERTLTTLQLGTGGKVRWNKEKVTYTTLSFALPDFAELSYRSL